MDFFHMAIKTMGSMAIFGVLFLITACSRTATQKEVKTLEVSASAYNSTRAQTQGNPFETAWGDTLEPGMKAIAVSRDLIPLGLGYGAEVEIKGLPGKYTVLDKMHYRWRKRIDIYFGMDVERAREWGIQDVTIRWVQVDTIPLGD